MQDQPSPVLSKIAYFQNVRGEVPNQELARALAETRNTAGIQEIAAHLWDKNKNVQSDCLKVLYEIGYLAPDLIAGCADDFLKLLHSKNNRLVWGAMIGLAAVAGLRAGGRCAAGDRNRQRDYRCVGGESLGKGRGHQP
jgi:hypothetical protein